MVVLNIEPLLHLLIEYVLKILLVGFVCASLSFSCRPC